MVNAKSVVVVVVVVVRFEAAAVLLDGFFLSGCRAGWRVDLQVKLGEVGKFRNDCRVGNTCTVHPVKLQQINQQAISLTPSVCSDCFLLCSSSEGHFTCWSVMYRPPVQMQSGDLYDLPMNSVVVKESIWL